MFDSVVTGGAEPIVKIVTLKDEDDEDGSYRGARAPARTDMAKVARVQARVRCFSQKCAMPQ